MAIDPITSASLKLIAPSSLSTGPAGGADAAGFGASLGNLIGSVEGSATEANDAVSKMIDGTGDVHEAMIALQKADVMLQLTVQIRNKLVQAYQDVMRMPV
jgi:flagellar hook-basal body complex protein FliE